MAIESGPTLSCASLLKALADETRLGVVRQLLGGARQAGEIQRALGIEQSLLSHHLRHLRLAGIVVAERDGKGVRYSLAPEVDRQRRGGVLDLGCCRLSFDATPS